MLIRILVSCLILYWLDAISCCDVNIKVEPTHVIAGRNFIKTHTNITFTASLANLTITQPSNLTYEWLYVQSSKNLTLPGNSSQITYAFESVDEDSFVKVVVKQIGENSTIVKCSNEKLLSIRDQINIVKKEITQHIYHGDLFSATFVFNGTLPVDYSYRLCHNSTHNKTCYPTVIHPEYFGYSIRTKDYYLRVGNYTINLDMNNYASDLSQTIAIKVFETLRRERVNYVPLISCILAVLILLFGVAIHFKFKKSITTETADFDCTREVYGDEEWDEVQTFGERLRYLLFGLKRSEQECLLGDSSPSKRRSRNSRAR